MIYPSSVETYTIITLYNCVTIKHVRISLACCKVVAWDACMQGLLKAVRIDFRYST
jgi:hypothetical protein